MRRTLRAAPGPHRAVPLVLAVVALLLATAPPALAQSRPAPDAPARPAPVVVETDTATPGPRQGQWRVAVPEADAPGPLVSTVRDPAAGMVNRLYRSGRAIGLAGVLYDNRDRDHSRLPLDRFPQLRETRYGPGFADQGLDRGLAGPFLFDIPVLGNASLALTAGPFKRSLPRMAMQNQITAESAHALFAANHLYVYPEHRDHDLATGDRFAAQTPYAVISQGSSRSDRPFLTAFALTSGAFRPETFERLRDEGLLPATAQMILRRTRSGIMSDAAYLSAAAHPTAFDRDSLRMGAMVALAAAMPPDEIPPMVTLEVTRDFAAVPGRDYLAQNLSETLFTTPSAIARVWRSFEGQRRMEISAEATRDPNGHPLTFSWVLLRGDPAKVRITPSGPGDARAEIVMDWHDSGEITGPSGIAASRIEIAVIANNGHYLSAPAFVSVAVPLHQDRAYAGRGADARLWQIDYAAGERYADPLIWPVAEWRDRMAHDADGRVETVTRQAGPGTAPYVIHRDAAGGWRRRAADGTEGARFVHGAEGPPERGLSLVTVPLP